MIDRIPPSFDYTTASSGTPLDAVVFDRLMMDFAPFEALPKLLVGVSGGADSMALALLAHEWCQARGGRILAVTIDHGLRAGAADEARWVAQELGKYDIDHVIRDWRGSKPAAAVQEHARNARYQMFDDLMREMGIFHLLVAHHANDQAETIAMRTERGTTQLGLAGMSARRNLRHGRLLRPLLSIPKADLIATLNARGQAWVEDPSNRNEKFERVRVRHALKAGQAPDIDETATATRRQDLEARIGKVLAAAVILQDNGVAVWDPNAHWGRGQGDDAPRHPQLAETHALGQVVRTVGGAAYMPALDKLASAMARFAIDPASRISLGGCVLHGRKNRIYIYRELGRMDQNPVVIDTKSHPRPMSMRWDNRFEWWAEGMMIADVAGLSIGPLGLCDVFHTKSFRAALREIAPFIGNLPRAALASMPALYDKEALRSVGGLEVSELSDVLSAAGCAPPLGRGGNASGGRWQFAPQVPLWESGFKSSPKPDNLLA